MVSERFYFSPLIVLFVDFYNISSSFYGHRNNEINYDTARGTLRGNFFLRNSI